MLDLSGDLLGGVSITLDGVADDGPLGSEANVVAIESVRGTPSADILRGGNEPPTGSRAATARTRSTRAAAALTPSTAAPGTDVAQVDDTDSVTGCERVELPVVDPGPAEPAGTTDPERRRRRRLRAAGSWTTTATARSPARTATTPTPPCGPAPATCPGNGVDEDCAGGDAKRALAGGRLSFEFLAFRNGTTKAVRLLVRDLPAGGKAVLHCKGCGCLPEQDGQAQRRRREPPQAAQAPPARGRCPRGPPERAGRHDPRHPLHDARQGPAAEEALALPGAGRLEAGPLHLTRPLWR